MSPIDALQTQLVQDPTPVQAPEATAAKPVQPEAAAPATTDNINLSPQATVAAQLYGSPNHNSVLSASTADGALATVARKADGDGSTYTISIGTTGSNGFSMDFRGDISISKDADGAYSVYNRDTDMTYTFAADGSRTETDGWAGQADADSIYVNVSGQTMTTGNGNNTVFVYGHGATIEGGSGNDTVILNNGLTDVTIKTGDGNDQVIASGQIKNAHINVGEGDNQVSIGSMSGGSIMAGNGDNSLKASSLTHEASVVMGDGDNSLSVTYVGTSHNVLQQRGSASITLGNGDNYLKGYAIENLSSVALGNGNNRMDFYEVSDSSAVSFGNGDNRVEIYEIEHNASVSFGNGNNTLQLYELEDNASLSFGNGHNRMRVYETTGNAALSFGDGDNRLQMYGALDNSAITFGNGNNSTMAYAIQDNSALAFGDGDNIFMAYSIEDNASLRFGNGDNLFYASFMNHQANVSMGSGRNRLLLQEMLGGVIETGPNSRLYDLSKLTEQESATAREDWDSALTEQRNYGFSTAGAHSFEALTRTGLSPWSADSEYGRTWNQTRHGSSFWRASPAWNQTQAFQNSSGFTAEV